MCGILLEFVEAEDDKFIPFAEWETVLEQLKNTDPFIYGLVFNAIVYEKGPHLYMKSPMGSLVSNLKKDNAAARLTAVVKEVTGKTYQERKTSLQELAIEYSNTCYPDLSYGELATVDSFFETQGRRYGLLREFKENAIC